MIKITPSIKLKIIKAVADALSGQPWSDVDLTLSTFEFPLNDNPASSDIRGYVMESMRNGDDAKILSIGRHFDLISDEGQHGPGPSFWGDGQVRLFISHLTTHGKLAHEIKKHLSEYGISSFVAHDDIEPTKEWQEQIEIALDTADCGIALLHTGFSASPWCPMEIGWLLGRKCLVISVKLEMDPFGFMGKNQALKPISNTPSDIAGKVIAILSRSESTSELIKNACCHKLENASSYIEAKEVTDILVGLGEFNKEQKSMITSALKNNSQVKNAFGVPAKLSSLI